MEIRKKFDKKTYDNIKRLYREGKLLNAKKYIYEYLEIYPQDISAKILLSKILISLKEYEEAEKLLYYCIEKYSKYDVFKENLVYLYMEQDKYQEAYKIYSKIKFNEYQIINVKATLELAALHVLFFSKLNVPIYEKEGYIANQYKNYSEQKALIHIYENHLEGNRQEEKDYLFSKTKEELEEIFKKISERIGEGLEKNPHIGILDNYYFKCENIGENEYEENTDIIKVSTIKNTNQIITMYPVEKKQYYNIHEIETKKEYTSGKKVRRINQIDKFNQKYKAVNR